MSHCASTIDYIKLKSSKNNIALGICFRWNWNIYVILSPPLWCTTCAIVLPLRFIILINLLNSSGKMRFIKQHKCNVELEEMPWIKDNHLQDSHSRWNSLKCTVVALHLYCTHKNVHENQRILVSLLNKVLLVLRVVRTSLQWKSVGFAEFVSFVKSDKIHQFLFVNSYGFNHL